MNALKCPTCSAENLANARLCGNCRFPLLFKKCANCNEVNDCEALTCGKCHAALSMPKIPPIGDESNVFVVGKNTPSSKLIVEIANFREGLGFLEKEVHLQLAETIIAPVSDSTPVINRPADTIRGQSSNGRSLTSSGGRYSARWQYVVVFVALVSISLSGIGYHRLNKNTAHSAHGATTSQEMPIVANVNTMSECVKQLKGITESAAGVRIIAQSQQFTMANEHVDP